MRTPPLEQVPGRFSGLIFDEWIRHATPLRVSYAFASDPMDEEGFTVECHCLAQGQEQGKLRVGEERILFIAEVGLGLAFIVAVEEDSLRKAAIECLGLADGVLRFDDPGFAREVDDHPASGNKVGDGEVTQDDGKGSEKCSGKGLRHSPGSCCLPLVASNGSGKLPGGSPAKGGFRSQDAFTFTSFRVGEVAQSIVAH